MPQDRQLLVHAGDQVEAGDPLIEGPLVPHDILRIRGDEALQDYLLAGIQSVYRSQNVGINDKHVEIIIAQMLRKVRVENAGDSVFLPMEIVDRFRFRDENEQLSKSMKIVDPGDTELKVGQIVAKSEFNEANEATEDEGGEPAKGKRPKQATASTILLGITKASLQSESFISAASFQETTKVLTEAALASTNDELLGLKENVILGHLIPAGTGFKRHVEIGSKQIGEPIPLPEAVPGEVSLAGEQESGAFSALTAGTTIGEPAAPSTFGQTSGGSAVMEAPPSASAETDDSASDAETTEG